MDQQIKSQFSDVIVGSSAETQRVEVEEAKGVEGGYFPRQ
jgi:hypothetical protein